LDFNSAINVFSVLSYSKVAGAKSSLMWRLIGLSAVMLVTGYCEAVFTDQRRYGEQFQMLLIMFIIFGRKLKKLRYKTFNLGI
jgi:hypothetical protein